ncbi:MAG: oligosaccharide flippase family protein [Phycisphaerales bacterium]|nr:oligosaccharide flippase family protein [Phycisphaerales bacterium]
MIQTIGGKGANMIMQLVLTYLLDPAEWGVVALAWSFAVFIGIIQSSGMNDVLVHRQSDLVRLANPGFWLSMTLGLVAAGLLAGLVPFASGIFGEPRLPGLLLVIASSYPLHALSVVPKAQLRSALRFRFIATTEIVFASLQAVLSVVFALLDFGAYSFVLPVPIIALVRGIFLWAATRPPIRWNPQFGLWRLLWADGMLVLIAAFAHAAASKGDQFVLGLFHDDRTLIGLYFWGFSLSLQTMQLLGQNLTNVLFPALARLQDDPPRQVAAFLRAARAMGVVGVPVCLLQAALADPVIHIVFPAKWYPAIPIVQILSIGMALRLVATPAESMLKAGGRWIANLAFAIAYAVVFVLMTGAAAASGGIVLVAAAVTLCYAIMWPIAIRVAIARGGGRWRDVLRIYVPLVPIALLAVGPITLVAHRLPEMPGRAWVQVALVLVVGAAAYLPLAMRYCRQETSELASLFIAVFRGRFRRAAPMPEVDPRSR